MCPPVRLVNSSATSISVEWDRPTFDGGSPVMGYELWMDDWSGGDPRMVFDGSGQPDVREFTVRTKTSIGVESGRQYRFMVRAVNYCSAQNQDLLCYGGFSPPSVFTVRAPRTPLPPLAPSRGSTTGVGSLVMGDGEIDVRWEAPDDNGGANITEYQLWMAQPGHEFQKMQLDSAIPSFDRLPGRTTLMRHVVSGLDEGEMYRFYVQAVNSQGRSARSPVMSTLAATVPGRDATLNHTYARSRPKTIDIGETSIHVQWSPPALNSTGGSAITGYKLYMYPGASLNTVADPDPVKQEVQRVVVTSKAPTDEQQRLLFTNIDPDLSTVRLRVAGNWTTALKPSAHNNVWAAAIASAFGCSACVTVDGEAGLASGNKTITFVDLVGLDLVAVDESDLTAVDSSIDSNVTISRVLAGTSELSGTFTLSFRGTETAPIKTDASAEDVKIALEDLDTISVVSVSANTTSAWGSREWLVTFDSEPGDLPIMGVTSGRLSYDAHTPSAYVETILPGSAALLVYDGSNVPDMLDYEVTGLTPDSPYAFKVVPINLVGDGLLSRGSITVIARAGASAAQTTASGGALETGMAGVIYEQQIINVEIGSGELFVRLALVPPTPWSVALYANDDGEKWEAALEAEDLEIGDVHVTRQNVSYAGRSIASYTITFIDRIGDVPLLKLNGSAAEADTTNATEFLKGRANEFIIEPKKASGDPLRDLTAARNRAGLDVFFTELWQTNTSSDYVWYNDGGVATYNPATYEIQRVMTDQSLATSFRLTFNQTDRASGVGDTTAAISRRASAYELKIALEELDNIETVDVSRSGSAATGYSYDVTFTHDLGERPLLHADTSDVSVVRLQSGITEIQTIVLSCDTEFVKDEQSLNVKSTSDGYFKLRLGYATDTTINLAEDATAEEVSRPSCVVARFAKPFVRCRAGRICSGEPGGHRRRHRHSRKPGVSWPQLGRYVSLAGWRCRQPASFGLIGDNI